MRSQCKGILLKLLLTLVVFGLCFVWSEKGVFLQEDYSQPAMILDAGHGGIDPGTLRGTVYEKNVNFKRSNNDIEIMSINAKKRFQEEKGGMTNE